MWPNSHCFTTYLQDKIKIAKMCLKIISNSCQISQQQQYSPAGDFQFRSENDRVVTQERNYCHGMHFVATFIYSMKNNSHILWMQRVMGNLCKTSHFWGTDHLPPKTFSIGHGCTHLHPSTYLGIWSRRVISLTPAQTLWWDLSQSNEMELLLPAK